jgi:N-acetylated-alpha-linked acidic dipeptidase
MDGPTSWSSSTGFLKGVEKGMARIDRSALVAGLLWLVAFHCFAAEPETDFKGFLSDEIPSAREWEERYRAIPRPENLREYMRFITEEPHIAGLPGSKRVADYVLAKFQSFGLNAWIEETQALMPLPTERHLELLAPESYVAKLEEPALAEDKDSADPGQLPTYNAYAGEGDVEAQVVYVNYGTPEDYEELDKMGIDVRGKIAIARYGRSWRGIKAKLAQSRGAVGCLIYSDPRDDGYFEGVTYPQGPFRPEHGVQRGSIMDMPVHPGDPLSPGFGAKTAETRLAIEEARTLIKIPVLPISYGDALPFLRNLRGKVAPEEWRGALPITYHIGPGPSKARLKLSLEWKTRPLYNVIARIDGTLFPDEWIVHGNHHDAWNNGAEDPTSGNVALMETARSFAEILKQGWKPKRTLVFASWDGEEWGLLGSTEWAETHKAELMTKGVVYINSDSTGKGWLNMAGSHTLQELVNDVARSVQDPVRGVSLWEAARARALERANDEERAEIEKSEDLRIAALGSGSDYTAFLDHLTMASLNLGFGGESDGGIYHSNYDSFDWYTRFSDGEFVYGRALSQVIGTTMMRLANATILPFNFVDLADTMDRYVVEIEKTREKAKDAPEIDLAPVKAAIGNLRDAGQAYEAALSSLKTVSTQALEAQPELRRLNQLLYSSERRLAHDEGLPKREWFRHQIYAPGLYTGYGVKTIPGIREGIEEEAWEEAKYYVKVVSDVLDGLVAQVGEARALVDSLARR